MKQCDVMFTLVLNKITSLQKRKINQKALLLWVIISLIEEKTKSTKKQYRKQPLKTKEITSIFQVIKVTEEFRKLCKYSKPIVQYITHNKTFQYSTVYQ